MIIDYSKYTDGLVPAIVQDATTLRVLMLGFVNEESLRITKETGHVTFFSRSRNQLWTKGETSGNFLKYVSMMVDCDADTVLIKARPIGPVCHTGQDTCFNERNELPFLQKLSDTIQNRYEDRSGGSYTSGLFEKGINAMAQKVGEEAVELVIEAKDNDENRFLNEAADLLFHYMVLLRGKGYSINDVISVLETRHK
ncbi:MAG: bifunctional phosphoribosyl-AMP cyclohydrolase/phosphoribosyl-ATP diphosphatase HisIE [Chitinophagaceae bacterium]|nr:bifunctional phosphoribosyl-AMP cyclohydrolase/phosphoribosyl-ATP diphosphatase HisIE [Chitinophagaceae bacterium]